jgi:hypothetical protein
MREANLLKAPLKLIVPDYQRHMRRELGKTTKTFATFWHFFALSTWRILFTWCLYMVYVCFTIFCLG